MKFDYSADISSLYIHWPFCPYRCRFCPFVAMAGHDNYMGQYHEALMREIRLFGDNYSGQKRLETIYLGGGTPSTWPNELLLDTFGTLNSVFFLDKSCEITIEVNPGTVNKEQLALWRELGINRLSIGVQSLNDTVLRDLGRYQTAKDVKNLMGQVGDYFENISIDCIIGLPGVDSNEWKEQMRSIVAWPISHISLYFLSIHEETRLYGDLKRGTVTLPNEDEIIDQYYWTIDFLAQHGLKQYELSSFARLGYESRHNMAYWDRKSYKGFGLGAWSYDGKKRFQNQKSLLPYMEGIHREDDITDYVETLSPEQVRLEEIMLGLRQAKGVSKKELFAGRSDKEKDCLVVKVSLLKSAKILVEREGRLILTPAGLLVENRVATELSG